MLPAPRPEPRRWRAGAVLALALGLVAAEAPPPAPRAYLLLSAPSQQREILKGAVRGSAVARYVVVADPGKALDVRLTAANPDVYFTLRTPGGSVLLYDSSDPDARQRFSRRLAPGGRYRLEVRLADAAARRNTTAPYTLSVARGGKVTEVR
ncbi:MAG: hypothetical protein KKE02_06345 [Alphaproteobacteria bacterium]|nr:hypothetical protein [Alphaproteobacteria bacterium]MBU1513112.1 hypothetical protein [Alphaproteobacteria bacterium]MBU2095220.1 hypothetical protein [Alphaproteobacteria bacterium]MBU2150621.1 hypothetical protein [Alphaproteobacteria bacterium]MBU2306120.1 hypothetical protein [Alphaproteobacteria bacterium]